MSGIVFPKRIPMVVAACGGVLLSAVAAAPAMASCSTSGICTEDSIHTTEGEKQTAVTTQVQRVESKETVNLISNRIANSISVSKAFGGFGGFGGVKVKKADLGTPKHVASNAGMTGLSGGDNASSDGSGKVSAWANYNRNWLQNDWVNLKSSTHLDTGILGVDALVSDNVMVGMTVAYASSRSTNYFSNGGAESSTYSFTPYMAVNLLDGKVVVDAMTGLGHSDTTIQRSQNAITGKSNSGQWMGATHATYNYTMDKLLLSSKVGWLGQFARSNAYHESDGTNTLGSIHRMQELSYGTRASYDFGAFVPYIGVGYAYDASLSSPVVDNSTNERLGRHEVNSLAGVEWNATKNLTAGLEATHVIYREKEKNTGVVLSGRYTF